MKKLLIVTTIQATLGAFLLPWADYLRARGWRVDCIANADQPVPGIEDHFDHCYTIPWTRSPYDLANYARPAKILRELVFSEGYDVVHVHTPVAGFITRMALHGLRGKTGLKIFYTAHGFHFYSGAPLKNWLLYFPVEWFLARWTDALITINSEDYERALKDRFPARKIYQVPGVGIDLNRFSVPSADEKKSFRQRYGLADDDFVMFFAAELNANKNQALLVNAMPEILHIIPTAKLLLAGDGAFYDYLRDLVQKLGLERSVLLLGARHDVPALIAASDLGVSSSRREGLPVNVLEYLAHGLPVVLSDIRGHRDLVISSKNGLLYRFGDAADFARCVIQLYRETNLRKTMASCCRASTEKFSVVNAVRAMGDVYEDALFGGKKV